MKDARLILALALLLQGCAEQASCTFTTMPRTYEESNQKCPANTVLVEITATGVICADVAISCPVKGAQ